MSTYNISCEESMKSLNTHLTSNLFIGGTGPNAQDALTFELFNGVAPCAVTYPGTFSWFVLVNNFAPLRESWKNPEAKPAKKGDAPKTETKVETKVEAKAEEDDMFADAPPKKSAEDNMFEDDADEDPEEARKRQERMKKNLEAKKAKDAKKAQEGKAKEVVIAKSLIIIDIKVHDQEQDLDALAKKVLAIEKDGLTWKTEYKTPVIAFGMKKLVMGLVVEDEKVSIDDINEILESWEDEVQSVDIASFDKI